MVKKQGNWQTASGVKCPMPSNQVDTNLWRNQSLVFVAGCLISLDLGPKSCQRTGINDLSPSWYFHQQLQLDYFENLSISASIKDYPFFYFSFFNSSGCRGLGNLPRQSNDLVGHGEGFHGFLLEKKVENETRIYGRSHLHSMPEWCLHWCRYGHH